MKGSWLTQEKASVKNLQPISCLMVKDCMRPKVDNKIKMTKMSSSVTSIQHYSGDFTQSNQKIDRKETEMEIKKYEDQKEKSSIHQYDSLYFKNP